MKKELNTKLKEEISSEKEKNKDIKLTDSKEKKEEFINQKETNEFIPLKDDPKFENEAKIIDIQKELEEIKQFEINKDGIPNKKYSDHLPIFFNINK